MDSAHTERGGEGQEEVWGWMAASKMSQMYIRPVV